MWLEGWGFIRIVVGFRKELSYGRQNEWTHKVNTLYSKLICGYFFTNRTSHDPFREQAFLHPENNKKLIKVSFILYIYSFLPFVSLDSTNELTPQLGRGDWHRTDEETKAQSVCLTELSPVET